MESETLGRRERKKLATRAALGAAALQLAVAHGVEHVTVEQIADEADVAVRTFFNYFSSKEEAVVAGDGGTGGSFVAAFAERPADEPVVGALREAALVVVGGEAYRDRARVEQMRAVRHAPALLPHQLAAYAEHERALAAAVAERTGPAPGRDLYPTLVAASAMAALRVVLQSWLAAGPDPDDPEPGDPEPGDPEPGDPDGPRLVELVDAAFAQLAAGLTAPVAPPAR